MARRPEPGDSAFGPPSVLKIAATDPGSVADMAAFSRSTGHEILDRGEGGGEVVLGSAGASLGRLMRG